MDIQVIPDGLARFKNHPSADSFKLNVWGQMYPTNFKQNAILTGLYRAFVNDLRIGLEFAQADERPMLWVEHFDPEVLFNFRDLKVFDSSVRNHIREHISNQMQRFISYWSRTVNQCDLTLDNYIQKYPNRLNIKLFNSGVGVMCEYNPTLSSGIPRAAGMVRRISQD